MNRIYKLLAISLIVPVLLSLLFFSSTLCEASPKKTAHSILILNSYSQGLTWTTDQTDGIIATFRNSGQPLQIAVEDMDWKNYPSQDNLKQLTELYEEKYKNKHFDIIITTDDAALGYALKHRKEFFDNAPVIFSGVNKLGLEKLTVGESNFTGVLEIADAQGTAIAAKKLIPKLEKVYVAYDGTESGLSTGELAMEGIRKAGMVAIGIGGGTHADTYRDISKIEGNSILLLTSYAQDRTGITLDFEEFADEASKLSKVPVFHLYDFGLGHGVVGGSILSGQLQGKRAAEIALEILAGKDINSMPPTDSGIHQLIFDYEKLKQYKLDVSILGGGVVLINKPFSFYETYKGIVISVISGFVVLVAFILILLFAMKKLQSTKKNLLYTNEELEAAYEQVTAMEEVLRGQYDELILANSKLGEREKQLEYLAYHDNLTDLPNMRQLRSDFAKNIVAKDSSAALFFLDGDNFKYINDTLGHVIGDKLITMIANRIQDTVKNRGGVYRIGGDEFAIVIKGMDRKMTGALADDIIEAFAEPFSTNHSQLYISVSVGIAMYPEDGCDFDELFKFSDIAMYRAKDAGKGGYVIFDKNMADRVSHRVEMEGYLRHALEYEELSVVYQPQVNVEQGTILGYEALLRWNSPQLGSVSPEEFIKVAEDSRQIIEIGAWVLKTACNFICRINKQLKKDFAISINVSVLQLMQADYLDSLFAVLQSTGVRPDLVELEITESILMESYEIIGAKLDLLRAKGIKIALDDFGKGYSSLSYLTMLPIDILKVDKSFIDEINPYNPHAMTGNIITIGQQMGLQIVAEGVENELQLDYLKRCGCDRYQGFLFSKPINEVEIIEKFEKTQTKE